MTYPVNADDATTPTNSQGAKQGAEEFRALKTKVNSLAVANTSGASVRQAIQSANLDATGYNNAITTGVGLRPGLTATAIPYQLSYASGFLLGKVVNQDEAIVADVVDILGADLPINNTSYLYRTFGVAFKSTLIPKQEGYIFDKSKQALLNFEGLNGAITTTDDFGNTWTLSGSTISTAQFKFGTSSLDCTGGAAKYAQTTLITSLGDSSWEMSVWLRLNAAPGVGTNAFILDAVNAVPVGVRLYLNNPAGVIKLALDASSNGATNDIAAAVLGTNTVWNLNQWHKIRIVFDALAGTYRVYLSLNGAAETQDISVSSSAKISAITQINIGRNVPAATSQNNAWFDAFRFLSCATKTTTEVPSAVAPTITDFTIYFFQLPAMKGFEVTAASVVAGVNPTLSAANNLFLGEADTSGVAITTIRNYAIKSQFVDVWTTPLFTTATVVSRNHKIGTVPDEFPTVELENITAEAGFVPGDRVNIPYGIDASVAFPLTLVKTRNTCGFTAGPINAPQILNKNTGVRFTPTAASWKYRVNIKRGY